MPGIVWQKSKADAFALAKAQGKKVLLLVGSKCCDGSLFMRDKVCELTSPSDIKGLIEQHFIPWYGGARYEVKGCVGDPITSDWYAYSPQGWFQMPLIAVIDPNTDKSLFSSTGITPRVVENASQFDNQKFYSLLAQYTTEIPVTPSVTHAALYFPHTAVIDDWQTEICVLNTGNKSAVGSLKLYDAKGTLTGEKPLTLPAFGRKQIRVNTEFPGIVVDYAVLNMESVSVQGYSIFWRPGEYSSALAAVGEGRTFGVFAKIEKEGGWTGIAFINTEFAPASVTLTAYTDAGIAVATKTLFVGSNGKVVNTIEKLFTGDISEATYVTYLSDHKVAGFELLGSADNKKLDGFNAL